jgi:hypothetical protein
MRRLTGLVLLLLLLAALPASAEARRGRSAVAALQVALRARGYYGGTIDGFKGPYTRGGLRRFQRRAGLVADGIAGPRTRRALGRRGRPSLGRRALYSGKIGWDVAQLQFLLAWHGFPSGPMDGVLGPRGARAIRRFQLWAGLRTDGIAGRATIHAVKGRRPRCLRRVRRPTIGRISSGFGPRGNTFHPGIDFAAPYGARVRAARAGRVALVTYDSGGYGRVVIVGDRFGVTSWYGHLSAALVRSGRRVRVGSLIGRVGSTGNSTGPHLHLELRQRGAAFDPRPCLR